MKYKVFSIFISVFILISSFYYPKFFKINYPEHDFIDHFQIKKISTKYYREDYEALMNSKKYIRASLGTEWPEDSLTLEKNLDSIKNDIDSFNKNENYTYSIFFENELIGSFYVSKNNETEYKNDHVIFVWMTEDHINNGNLQKFIKSSKEWLDKINSEYVYINEEKAEI